MRIIAQMSRLALAFVTINWAGGAIAGQFTISGTTIKTEELPTLLQSETMWGRIGEDCRKAYSTGFADPETVSARKRLEALNKLEQCLNTLKSTAAAQVSLAELPGLNMIFLGVETKVAAKQVEAEAQTEFLGLQLGVGVGISHSQDEIVTEAEIAPGNIVAATKTETQQPRVILESHYYGWCKSKACNAGRFGVGPFFGIVAKEEDLISALGAGVMFGWKDPRADDSKGMSIGIGVVLDANVKSLAEGFEDGEALPAGETEIRFEESSRWSALLIFTRTF